ncbi:glycosyltransferase [Sphingomonas sp. JC676]|uniref:glycosyltransferase family 2 protein n=1 Tax=Sphingomonas sp. JC676 TaxID=2768065 RepID=UPI001657F5EA|nr:glycosyltransferase [Sphingomonas sp. JC676]MBC9032802.1 glycosyltransferase [Sphingomonas sp. JC676]
MTGPRISVVVPHYNDPIGLGRCLNSLEAQTIGRDAFEIVVGDNDSPCGLEAVERAVAGRGRIVTIPEKGAGPARNGAAAAASGEILAFIDSDCVAEPGWLEAGAAAVATGRFIGGRMFVLRPQGAINGAQALEMVLAFDNQSYVRDKHFTVTANLFVMAEDFARVGPFRTGVSEDLEWCHRAIAKGLEIAYAPYAAVGHPPRDDWAALKGKARRIERELYLFALERPGGRAKWFVRSLLLPGMIAVEAPKLLRAPQIAGARVVALVTLVKIRLWRSAAGLRQSLGFDL